MTIPPAEGPVPHGAGPVAIPDGLEPIGVWDADDPEWRGGIFSERFFWLTGHATSGHWHLARTFRIEFYLLDAPFAVVHRYALDKDGFKHQDPATGEPAVEPPAIVPLDELPPAHLLGR